MKETKTNEIELDQELEHFFAVATAKKDRTRSGIMEALGLSRDIVPILEVVNEQTLALALAFIQKDIVPRLGGAPLVTTKGTGGQLTLKVELLDKCMHKKLFTVMRIQGRSTFVLCGVNQIIKS